MTGIFICYLPGGPEEEGVDKSDPQWRTCPGGAGRYPSILSQAESWY